MSRSALSVLATLFLAAGLAVAQQSSDAAAPQQYPPAPATQQPSPTAQPAESQPDAAPAPAPPDQNQAAEPQPAPENEPPAPAADAAPQPLQPPTAPPAEASAPVAKPAIAPAVPNQVPTGFRFLVTLAEPLDTATVARGKHFRAMLREPLVAPNGETLAGGHWITGHVSEVERGYHAMLLLSFDEIQTSAGWVPLAATVVEVPSEHGLRTPGSEGEIERKPINMRRTLEDAGAGAVIGASATEATGADAKTTAMGAAEGAATGAGVAALTDRNILLDRGAQLVLRLDRGIYLP